MVQLSALVVRSFGLVLHAYFLTDHTASEDTSIGMDLDSSSPGTFSNSSMVLNSVFPVYPFSLTELNYCPHWRHFPEKQKGMGCSMARLIIEPFVGSPMFSHPAPNAAVWSSLGIRIRCFFLMTCSDHISVRTQVFSESSRECYLRSRWA